jgi:predicted  nucleic acid-binding Zn-ribbon protein
MRSALAVLGIAALLAAPTTGQIRGQRQTQQPTPDAWMTIDSLATVLELTADQRDAVAPQLTELNDVMKQASEQRTQLRSQMSAGERPSPEAFTAMREQMAAMQEQIDEHYGAIRALLSATQQAAFDALQKPTLMRAGPGRRP